MPKIGIVAAELLKQRSGGETNMDKALGIVLRTEKRAVDTVDRMSDRLFEMQTAVEVANEDLARRDATYLEHITKVRDLLECGSEDDLYEKIRTLKNHRVLALGVMQNLRTGLPLPSIYADLDAHAEELAAMHTANAGLFRDNLALRQELEALRDQHQVELDAAREILNRTPE